MKRYFRSVHFTFLFVVIAIFSFAQNKIVVFQTDYGLKDGAVAAMKGVAMGVSPDLKLYDLTHEIPAYNIWEAAYRLQQTVEYWPAGTVFVSVVDPGVGTSRKSVVLKTRSGHFIVTPDNGTLTLVAQSLGIAELRQIDETVNRRKGSEGSYTFHGRDVYAYTAARLAAGVISFEQVGPALPNEVVSIPFQKAKFENARPNDKVGQEKIRGTIAILDIQYGNIWTNIPNDVFDQLGVKTGDSVKVSIYHNNIKKYEGKMPYAETFGSVAKNKPLLYLNSLMQVAFALNMGNFSETYHIYSGGDWTVVISKLQ